MHWSNSLSQQVLVLLEWNPIQSPLEMKFYCSQNYYELWKVMSLALLKIILTNSLAYALHLNSFSFSSAVC